MLQCHTQFQARMAARTGLHALYQGRQCVECHKEHHGKNFPVVKFDVKSFNHSTVGFALQGGHLKLSCQQCHKRDNVKAEDVLKNAAALERELPGSVKRMPILPYGYTQRTGRRGLPSLSRNGCVQAGSEV